MQQMMESLEIRKSQMEERVRQACQRAGRNSDDVTLIAVTKYSSLAATQGIFQLGLSNLGESRWQEAKHKWETIGSQATWHFIGHLQTNKVKDVISKFTFIHSLDRSSLATELNRKAEQLDIVVKCLIQLNISGEQSKHGLDPKHVVEFCRELRDDLHILPVGLMTMAPYDAPTDEVRHIFRELRLWRDKLNELQILSQPLHHLSMGMSDDFEIAIEEGATMIRLGSALMGHE
jgi:pyridoxal phosphate enzyme (YggS family)